MYYKSRLLLVCSYQALSVYQYSVVYVTQFTLAFHPINYINYVVM